MRKIFFYGFLIFIFSIGIGYYYSSLWKRNSKDFSYENQVKLEDIQETASVEKKISYDTNFALKKYYTKCGHIKMEYSELPIELVNLTEKELEKEYKDWNTEKFENNEVILSKNVEGMCDEHYVLKLEDDYVEVLNIGEKGETKLYKVTNISKDYLTSDDIKKLEEGIYVYGISSLNSTIEDFE